MTKVRIKSYSRKSKTGKVSLVKQHERSVEEGHVLPTQVEETFFGITEKSLKGKVRRVVQNKNKASDLLRKYSKYPRNLSVMINGKWKKDGDRTVLDVSQKELIAIVKENAPLVSEVISRMYHPSSANYRDMKAVAVTAIYEALNNYGVKNYNPKDPVDIASYIRSYVEGFIKNDIASLYSVDYSIPINLKNIFFKYKEAYTKFDGDENMIYNNLKLTQDNVFQNGIKTLLPKDDFVSEAKESALKNKLVKYEKDIQKIRSEYESDLANITKKQNIGYDESELMLFEAGVKQINKDIDNAKLLYQKLNKEYVHDVADFNEQIEQTEKEIAKEEGLLEKNPNRKNVNLIKLSNKLGRLKSDYSKFKLGDKKEALDSAKSQLEENYNRLSMFKESMEPRTDADISALKLEAYDTYTQKMKLAKSDFDKDVSKTYQTGFSSLAKVFNEMMAGGRVDIAIKNDDGDETQTIELFKDKESEDNTRTIEETEADLQLKLDYKKARDKFETKVNLLDPVSRDIVKMRLGLHESNIPYEHGLSGHYMDFREIAKRIPEQYFVRDNNKHKKSLNNWLRQKPSNKVKKSDAQFQKDEKDYATRQKVARLRVEKLSKGKNKQESAQIRERVYSEMKVTKQDRPTRFQELSEKKYNEVLNEWKTRKPKPIVINSTQREQFISGRYDAATKLLRGMLSKNDVFNFMNLHNQMIERGIEKADFEYTLIKSLTSIIYNEQVFTN